VRALRVWTVAGVLTALVAACGSSRKTESTTRASGVASSAPVASGPRRLHLVATSPVPIDGPPLLAGFGAVWSASSHGLVRLSVPSGRPQLVLRSSVDDIVLSGCCVYALSGSKNSLIEFDPSHMKTKRRWTLPAGARSLAAGDHQIYVAVNGQPAEVERIDLQTGATRRVAIPHTSGLAQNRAIAAAPGQVWVIDGSSIYRLNAMSLSVINSRSLEASDIWFGDGSLWAASENPNGGVERIDPTSDRILASDNEDAIQMAFSPHAVWLAAAAGPTAIDPVTARPEAALPAADVPTQGAGGIAVVDNEVWTVYTDIGKLQRASPGG
jgi:hypothetical protein